MRSLWLDRSAPVADDPLPLDQRLDVLVVGAGLTGLTTALLLARAGRRVAVVEARSVGAVTTGNTTGKVSLLQGTHLSRVLDRQSPRVARSYVEANRDAQAWLLELCATHDVPVQRRPAYTYAASPDEVSAVRREHDVARSLGLPVEWRDRVEVPFPVHAATMLADQAQLDAMEVLGVLVDELRSHGGTLHQGRRVTGLSLRAGPRVRLDSGESLRAERVVLATGTPILDRGLSFARLEPLRSYGLAFDDWPDPPEGMYLSAGSDARSVRDAPTETGTLLLVGGSGHVVGRTGSEREHLDRLRAWTTRYFPGATETHRWSAQDYRPHAGLPLVGRMPGGRGRVFVATGYDKWGLTNAVVAARTIAGEIVGDRPPGRGALVDRVTRPAGIWAAARTNLGVGVAMARGLVRGWGSPAAEPEEGGGSVGRRTAVPTAVSRQEGQTCAVVGVCTHLGGVLRWNDAEKSWDCPLHGSRFSPTGAVLEGPATRPLIRRTERHDQRR